MRRIFLFVSTSFLLIACAGNPINTDKLLTLAFYPDCDYQVLSMVKGVAGYTEYEYTQSHLSGEFSPVDQKFKGTQEEALYQLKKKALDKGADAIAITSFQKIMGSDISSKGRRFNLEKFIYKAQAIKLCSTSPVNPYNTANSNVVSYDEEGNFNFRNLITSIELKTTITMKDNESVTPELSNHTVSTLGDVYGLSLGMSKDQLLSVFGTPSVTIRESETKHIIQYGRRHLFYIINNEFVAYKYSNWLLPPHINNEVPYNDNFDELKWTLDNGISRGDSIEKIKGLYGDSLIENYPWSFTVRNKGINTDLIFNKSKDQFTEKDFYTLSNIIVSKKGTFFKSWDQIISGNTFNRSIDISNSVLPIMPYDSKQQVINKLGKPKAVMRNERGRLTWIYDNELNITFYNDDVFYYSFEKSTFKTEMNECKHCLYLNQDVKMLPMRYITKTTDFEYFLENNGIEYTVNFSNIEGEKRVNKIRITTKYK
jgi:hypothetical protein